MHWAEGSPMQMLHKIWSERTLGHGVIYAAAETCREQVGRTMQLRHRTFSLVPLQPFDDAPVIRIFPNARTGLRR